MIPTAAGEAADLLRQAAQLLRASPWRRGCLLRLPPEGALLATGDLHDNPVHLAKLVRLARLDRSPGHHLVLHELIHGDRLVDGVDLSHRMMLRVAELVRRHPAQVHPLLANHEIAQLTGRGVSKGAGNSVELFDDGLERAFGDDWTEVADAVKEFIGAMCLALRSDPADDGGVFCAHSLPSASVARAFDESVFDRELTPADYAAPAGAAYQMTWGRELTPEHLAELGRRWHVRLFCLGHQHAETGIELLPPNAVVLNSDHDRAAALPIDLSAAPSADEACLMAVPLRAVGGSGSEIPG